MKVNIGDSVKNIPRKYLDGVFYMKEAQLESPLRKRLTPFERFLLAEATWRSGLSGLDCFTRDHLDGFEPVRAALQTNRSHDQRCVVYYKDYEHDLRAMAIVPNKVFRRCPKDMRIKEYFEF